jgi:hypothetical protein
MSVLIHNPETYIDIPKGGPREPSNAIRVTVYDGDFMSRHAPAAQMYFTPADFIRTARAMQHFADNLRIGAHVISSEDPAYRHDARKDEPE